MFVGSLFSGIGGVELGFEREGFHTSWFVENNLYCQAVLKKHWPNVPIYGDIKTLDFRKVEHVDILVGGFPCQDISVAGKRKGMAGARSGLWSEFSRAIVEIRPRYVVVENVPNLLNLGIEKVLGDISQAGYDCEWFTIRASQFGAIHRRERIFIIAYPNRERGSRRGEEKSGEEAFNATNEGRINAVAHSDGERFNGGNSTSEDLETKKWSISERIEKRKRWLNESSERTPFFLADDWSQRIQGFREESLQGEQGFSRFKNVGRIEELFGNASIPEPLIRRSSNGIPNRLDRTKCIGNAVVPVVAQFIARQIKEREGMI